MKTTYLKLFLLFATFIFLANAVTAQTTEFTYQGSLKDSGNPANATYDFEFALFDALSGGSQIGATIPKNTVTVTNGVFAVKLDFGSVFPGANRYLEIRVRLSGQPSLTPLTPRQLVNSAPYSLKSLNSDNATNAGNATSLGGTAANQFVVTTDPRMTDSRSPTTGSSNYIQNTTSQQPVSNFSISGNGIVGSNLTTSSLSVVQGPIGSGLVATVTGSANLTGTSTQFTTTFQVGDAITVSGQSRTITSIASDTLLTVDVAFSGTGNNLTYTLVGGTRMVVKGSGNVGIGTNNPGENLDVQSNGSSVIRAKSSGGSGILVLDRAAAVSANSAQLSFSSGGATDFAMGTSQGSAGVSDFSIYNYGTASNAFTIQKSSSNVGIGTPAPNVALHLKSPSTTGFAIQMENTSTAKRLYIGNYGTTGGGPHWQGFDSANTSFLLAENTLVFTTPGGIHFSGSTTAEHMTILPNGNVGIGTTSPTEKLHVLGGRVIFNVPGNNGFRITPGTDADIGVLNVTNAANSVNWLTVGSNGQVIMNGSGNVGIGTTSPSAKLEIGNPGTSGALYTFRVYGVSQFMGDVKLSSISTYVSGVRPICAGLDGFISECSSSSLRYKTNIGNFPSGLDVIKALRPITFRWKSDGSSDFGLAAEEVEKTMPGLAYRNKDGQVDGVRYDRIGVVLINAVKEQQTQIEQQDKKINALEEEVKALKTLVCGTKRRAAICRK